MSDPLLESLRSAGTPTSSGRFTLDPDRALEKLRQFALPDPDRYAVHVVECAVLGGATSIEVATNHGVCSVSFDGEPLDPDDLEVLLPGLAGGRWGPHHRLHPLAMAVNGVLAGNAVKIGVETGDAMFEWTSWRARRKSPRTWSARNRVLVVRRWGLIERLLHQFPEREHLLVHCPYCPGLRAFGRDLGVPMDLGSPVAAAMLLSDEPLPPFTVRGAVPMRPAPPDFSALLLLGASRLKSGMVVQNAGRLYVDASTLAPGVSAVVAASRMRPDLGRNHLVRDGFYDRVLHVVRKEAEALRQTLARSFRDLEASARKGALPHLHQLSFEKASAAEWAAAAELAEFVAKELPPDHSGRRSSALYRAALLHHGADRQVRSLELASEALGRHLFQGGPHLRCEVDDPVPAEGGPFPCMPMRGSAGNLSTLQTWLLEMGAGVLGPHHPTVQARRNVLLDLCRRHGFQVPDETKFRNPWREPALGGFPSP